MKTNLIRVLRHGAKISALPDILDFKRNHSYIININLLKHLFLFLMHEDLVLLKNVYFTSTYKLELKKKYLVNTSSNVRSFFLKKRLPIILRNLLPFINIFNICLKFG